MGTFLAGGAVRIANLLTSDALVAVDWDGRPVFRLAESATMADDGRSLTVHLRPGVTFHSGEPVTAERVRELLVRRVLLMEEIRSIEVIGETTLVFSLRHPHSVTLDDLSQHPVEDDPSTGLRTGPFRVVSLDGRAVLEPYVDYYLGLPSVTQLEIEEYPSHRAAWTAMMRGEINFLHEVNRDAIDFVEADGSIRAYPLLRPYYLTLVFNLTHPVLGRRDVRLALSEAIDREEIVQVAMRGHGRIAEGPFWPHHWAYTPMQQTSAPNPAAARIRLDTGRLPVRPSRTEMPARFSFTCLVPADDARFERLALVVQRQLFAIGVDMRFQAVPQHELPGRISAGAYDAFLLELVNARTLSFPYQFWHSRTSRLASGYTAADAALDRMKIATSEPDVRAAVSDVMRIMRADPPAVFLAWPREARAADQSIDLPYEPDRDVFGTLWQARRATTARAGTR
jgi:peptide/nickel transport system substrate-binding protein